MLVSLGSALFTMVGAYGFEDFAKGGVTTDPSRIAAQVVTGIGFLGAGVIFRQGFTIRGLTTAASLWVVAAVGMASGAGFWKGAVVGTVVGIVSLRPLAWLKERAIPQRAAARFSVELAESASAGPVIEALESAGDLRALSRDGGRLEIEVRIDRDQRARVLEKIAALDDVREARWQS